MIYDIMQLFTPYLCGMKICLPEAENIILEQR